MKSVYSLKQKKEFNEVLQKGKKIYSQWFVISFLPSKELKIGISIPKKTGNAVLRNKNKRQIKNILSQSEIFEKKDLGIKVVIIFKKEWVELEYQSKKKIMMEQIDKLINLNGQR